VPLRNPTNVVWAGNPTNNIWDTTTTSNWLNNGNADFFVPGDNARFDSTGAINPLVNIPVSVTPGSVAVDTSSNYTFFGMGNIGGVGGLTKTNSGTLTVLTTNSYTGPTLVSGGVLEATNLSASGTPSSIGAASPDPTNLVVTDSILRYLAPASTSSDHGVTLGDLGGTLDLPTAGTTLTLNGPITGAALTKTGAGTLLLNTANTYSNLLVQSGTVTLGTATAAGTGSISNSDGTTLRVVGAVTVGNPFDAEGNVIIDLNNTGGDTAMSGAWSGSGTVLVSNQATGGRTFTMGGNGSGGGSMANFTGTINAGNCPGSFRFNNGGGSPNLGNPNMTLNLGSNTATFLVRNGGISVDIGALMGGPNTRLSGRGSGSTGTVIYSIGGKGLSTEFDGTITNGNDATAITLIGGSLRLTGTNTYTGATTVNAGTLQVDGQITTSAVTLSGGGTGVLAGAGVFGGAVDIQSGGTLIPGDGLGPLTINNSLTLESGSTNIFELNAASGTNSTIVGLSSVSYGGNLIVTNVSGTLSAGQTFTLFSASSYSGGTWDSITLPPLGAGLTWDTFGLTVNGTISVVTVTTPRLAADFSALKSSGTITFNATSGEPYAPVSVLSSTNVALPVASWTSVATGAFDALGNFSQSITVDPTTPTQFFILLEQ
jgi:autotransporter-associated beta strand protein